MWRRAGWLAALEETVTTMTTAVSFLAEARRSSCLSPPTASRAWVRRGRLNLFEDTMVGERQMQRAANTHGY